jgi:hypothetical protein
MAEHLSVLRDRVNWGYHADGSLKLVLPGGCLGTEFRDGVYSGVGNGTNGFFRLRWVDLYIMFFSCIVLI